MTKRRDPKRIYAVMQKQGWYPALWSHHPAEIKEAFKAFGWRPQLKYCWQNCQRFILDTYRHGFTELQARLRYHEGYVMAHGVVTPHAWLTFNGERLELTVDPGVEVVYLKSYEVTLEGLLARAVQTREFSPDMAKLANINPNR